MVTKLNDRAYRHAKRLITEGDYVFDDRDDWSEHQPPASLENKFIRENGFAAYALWHLGEDTDQNKENKGHHKFPFGDFNDVHRCGVLSAEVRAGQYKYVDIENAAAHLHGMIDAAKNKTP